MVKQHQDNNFKGYKGIVCYLDSRRLNQHMDDLHLFCSRLSKTVIEILQKIILHIAMGSNNTRYPSDNFTNSISKDRGDARCR